MSWLFSIIGNFNENDVAKAKTLLPESGICTIEHGKYLFLSGGHNRTCFSGEYLTDKQKTCWTAVGQGIAQNSSSYRFMNKAEWEIFLQYEKRDLKSLNGHFACGKINSEKAVFFNDTLGIRELFFAQKDDLFFVSTRLDLISKFTGFNEIDYSAFSSGWLLENRISTDSVIKKIRRLTAGSSIEFTFSENKLPDIKIVEKLWAPTIINKLSENDVIEELTKFTLFPIQNHEKLTLGLSGGLDSRVLFSILQNKNLQSDIFSTFTFGNRNHPDSLIATKIANIYNTEHKSFDTQPNIDDDIYSKLLSFTSMNQATSPLSEYFQKLYFETSFPDEVVIDGGFGEILRRGLFNKLLYKASNQIQDKNAEFVSHLICMKRADIFNVDISLIFEKSTVSHFEKLFDEMPDSKTFGTENWLDLLSIRTKLINYCSLEQARTDNFCFNFNPFSQPRILNMVFSLDLEYKKNAKLFNKIINTFTPELIAIPLVKGDVLIPFGYPTFFQKVIAKGKKKLGMNFKDKSSEIFLDRFKDMILEISNSSAVKEYPEYNYKKIQTLVQGYYSGNKSLAKEVDWWLSFEFFRQSLI